MKKKYSKLSLILSIFFGVILLVLAVSTPILFGRESDYFEEEETTTRNDIETLTSYKTGTFFLSFFNISNKSLHLNLYRRQA